ncbi:MAG: hypothetical protein IPF92_16050 [Myxococcales bacterium]|nr:hypothetical protein [Myxococcales bacterium]
MLFSRFAAAALPLTAAYAFSASLAACSSESAQNKDYGAPPDAGTFNPPPNPGPGDGYGSGGNTGGPPVCPEDFKACSHTFTYSSTTGGSETSVELRGDFGGPDTWSAGVAMKKNGAVWEATTSIPFGKPVQYKFFVNGTTWLHDPAQPTVVVGNDTNNTFAGKTCEPFTCAEPGAVAPGVFDWRDSVIYFAFVDRFFDGNTGNNCNVPGTSGPIANYQGGDWAGIKQKIDANYFNDLGVNTLWLTVPLNNTSKVGAGVGGDSHQYSGYHGYWPQIDDPTNPGNLSQEGCFGTMQELKDLVTAAHAKGLKVLFDYAMVHVHRDSGIFQQRPQWFWPNDNGRGGNCLCGQGCAWDSMPDRERCWFTDYLPHWNYTNADARNYSVTNAVEWAKQLNIDGFRADAIKHVDISWLTQLRQQIKTEITSKQTPPQRFYMVGETYDFGNRDVLKAYVDPGTKLDGQFDFPLRKNLVEAVVMRKYQGMNDLAAFMNGNDFFYGGNAIMSTFIGNHDLPRVIHLAANNRLWGDDQGADGKDRSWSNLPTIPQEREAFERLANAYAVLFTNRGAPLIYYGDEIGLPGAGDPDNRRFMQWTGLDANQTFLRDRVKKLLDIRAKHPATRRGVRATISADADTWVYSRTTTGDTVYVAVNRSDSEKTVSGLPGGQLDELVTGVGAAGPSATIPARQTRVFYKK